MVYSTSMDPRTVWQGVYKVGVMRGVVYVCSERGAMGPYADRIRKKVPGIDVAVSTCDVDPYSIV